MDIVLASRNKKKIKELKTMLCKDFPDLNVLSLDDIGYFDETEETGKTFEENARQKASVPAKMGYISIADDSGLCVDYLNGQPGIYSARFSGGNDNDNNALLLEKLKGVPVPMRTARYVCSVVCIFPEQKDEICITESCEGYITENPDGEGGFGYDPLFFYPPFGKTFGNTSAEDKNRVSHRGKAMEKFAKQFSEKVNTYFKKQ